MKYSIKSLLKYIVNNWADFKDYKILTNSQINNKARIQKISTSEIINIEPIDFGFANLNQSLDLTSKELTNNKDRLLSILRSAKNTKKYNIKTLLQEILKKNNEFRVLKNSRQKEVAIIEIIKTKSTIEIQPNEFGFKGLGENKEINKNGISKFSDILFAKINTKMKSELSLKNAIQIPKKKSLEFKIKHFSIIGDYGANEILNFRLGNKQDKFNVVREIISAHAKDAILEYCANIIFTTPVKIEMSFKSELDVTNHLYVFKIIEDRLVEKGIIKSDDDTMVKEITLKKHTDGDAAVIVKISEI
ncbi:MAG: hypothetical protein J6M14_06900 [Campylobacter sp.]|nr:hypothetical protein [Campylobacter sp.]